MTDPALRDLIGKMSASASMPKTKRKKKKKAFIVATAKSGTSKCRECQELIADKSTRVGVPANSSDWGDYHKWYHPGCAEKVGYKCKAKIVAKKFRELNAIFSGYPDRFTSEGAFDMKTAKPKHPELCSTEQYEPYEPGYFQAPSGQTNPCQEIDLCSCTMKELMGFGCQCREWQASYAAAFATGKASYSAAFASGKPPGNLAEGTYFDKYGTSFFGVDPATTMGKTEIKEPVMNEPDTPKLLTAKNVLEAVVSTHYQDAAEEVAPGKARVEIAQQSFIAGMKVYHVFKSASYILLAKVSANVWQVESPSGEKTHLNVAMLTTKSPGLVKRAWAKVSNPSSKVKIGLAVVALFAAVDMAGWYFVLHYFGA